MVTIGGNSLNRKLNSNKSLTELLNRSLLIILLINDEIVIKSAKPSNFSIILCKLWRHHNDNHYLLDHGIPQEVYDQEETGQGPETEPTHSSVDSSANWQQN